MTVDSLNGKVALITGASSGIGRASAELLAQKGAKVIINYNNNHAGAEEAKAVIEQKGGECLIVKADVTKKSEIDSMVSQAIETFGQIDILVNNAGAAIKRSSFLEIDEDLWQATFDLNVKSVFLVSQAVLKHMVPRKTGKIINMSSVAARLGSPGETVHYGAAKGAVSTMTVGLAREFAEHGIIVNGLAPGFIETPFQDKYSSPERRDKVINSVPLKRAGTAEEIAESVAFLASDASNYILGEIITVSGGR